MSKGRYVINFQEITLLFQVKIEDDAQLAADRARDLKERAIESQTFKSNEDIEKAKENTEEAFWSVQEKKWQALDAVQTAQATFDGSIANNADGLARSFSYVVPYVPGPVVSNLAPINPISPIGPLVYATPGFIQADRLKLLKEEKKQLEKNIEYLEKEKEKYDLFEKQRSEAIEKEKLKEQEKQTLVKTAEPEKKGEKKAALDKNLSEKPAILLYTVLSQPWSHPVYYQNPLVFK